MNHPDGPAPGVIPLSAAAEAALSVLIGHYAARGRDRAIDLLACTAIHCHCNSIKWRLTCHRSVTRRTPPVATGPMTQRGANGRAERRAEPAGLDRACG
jgi:hypothetical protein